MIAQKDATVLFIALMEVMKKTALIVRQNDQSHADAIRWEMNVRKMKLVVSLLTVNGPFFDKFKG